MVLIDAITDIKAEMKSATERIRSTLCIEIGDIQDYQPMVPGKDSPRSVSLATVLEGLPLEAAVFWYEYDVYTLTSAQSQFWFVFHLTDFKQACDEEHAQAVHAVPGTSFMLTLRAP